MKSYKQIAQEAGVDVETVRKIAKTIKRDETKRGAWRDDGGMAYATKTEAIEANAKAWGAVIADMIEANEFAREEAISEAGKAMDNHTPVKIYTEDYAIYDYIAGIEGDSTIVTEHFGAVEISGEPDEVEPWDMTATDKPMLCAHGVTLKWDRGTLAHSWYESADTNGKGERLTAVEMDTIEGGTTQGWLLHTWAKRGLIPHMTAAWDTNVYVRGADGKTVQADNPQITPNGEIDFKWILERTEANRLALLLEILKRFGK